MECGLLPLNGYIMGSKLPRAKSKNVSPFMVVCAIVEAIMPLEVNPTTAFVRFPRTSSHLLSGVIP